VIRIRPKQVLAFVLFLIFLRNWTSAVKCWKQFINQEELLGLWDLEKNNRPDVDSYPRMIPVADQNIQPLP